MRKVLAIAVVTAMVGTGAPVAAIAETYDAVELLGTAYTVDLQPLANAEIQIRNLKTGRSISSAFSDRAGEFTFRALTPGDYILEIVNPSGKVLGMTSPFRVGSAPTLRMSIVSVSQGVVTPGERAGVSLFGLGPMASLAVVAATGAGAGAVVGALATRPDASPSR